jgi:DNA-binding beta-propeller fold protein YncE
VAVAPNGRVYVADSLNHRIQYFTGTGSFLGRWGSAGTGDGQFDTPSGVHVGPDGTVYVSDTFNQRIQYFAPQGRFLGAFGAAGPGPGRFAYPLGLAMDGTGRRLYVVDSVNYRIQYFNYQKSEPAVVPASVGRVKAIFN